MKKICILVILITIVANIYIVFKWDPYKYEEYIPVNSYNINHNNDYKEVGEGDVSKIYDIKDETYYFNDYDTILTLNYDDISKIEEIFENMTYKLAFENVKYSWMDAIQEADISITQEDKDILKELGKVLGQTDADSQVNEIEVTESFLNMQIEKAEEARKKNQKMYKTLGVVVGLVFVIILI